MVSINKLVKRARKGDHEAFARLFMQYEAELYRMAYVYVRHEQDALDVVQETAYRAFKGIGGLKEPNYFKTWLIRIAISCSLDALRRRKQASAPLFLAGVDGEAELGVAETDALQALEAEMVAVSLSLQEILDRLDEQEKGVLLLRYYQDFTIREVAEMTGIPLGTAKTVLYRALRKLRSMVREEDYYE